MSAGGEEVGRISIRVVPDLDKFRQKLQKELNEVEKMTAKVQVTLDADTVGLRDRIERSVKDLKANVAVRADTAVAQAQIDTLVRDQTVKVRVDVDQSSVKQAQQAFGGLGGGAAGAGALGGGLLSSLGGGGDITTLLKVVAAVAAAAPAVAVLSGALASLPGVVAGIAAPIGAIALGLDGIKEAASTLAPEFANLKAAVSDTFAQALLPIFDQLRAVFPTLTAGMQQIASGLSTAFGGIVNALTSSGGLASLSTIFQNIGQAIAASAPGLEAFTGGLLKMAANITGLFPQLSTIFNQLGTTFGAWVDKMTTAGADGVSPLQSALQGLGSIAASIGPVLGDLFNRGLAFLQDPNAVQGVKNFINTLGEIAAVVMNVSTWFSQLNGVFNVFKGSILQLISLPQQFGAAITRAFGVAVSVVSGAVSNIVGAIQSGFSGLVGIISAAWNAAVEAVKSGVSQAVAATAEIGAKIVAACGNFGSLLVQAGRDLIQGLINGIKSMASAAWDAVSSIASGAVNKAKSILGINSPSKVFHGFGVYIGEGLTNGLGQVEPEVLAKIRDMAAGMKKEFSDNLGLKVPGVDTSAGVIGGSTAGNKIDGMKYAKDAMNMPLDFADAVAKSAMQDLNISGGGVLGAVMDYGKSFAEGAVGNVFNFHTSNVDDTLAIARNQQNKQALGAVGRT